MVPITPPANSKPIELTVWFTEPAAIRDADLLLRYWSVLNEAERERYARFATDKLKHDFLVTRAFARDVLSRSVGGRVAPREWRFAENRYGRPRVINPGYIDTLFFNLSHTDGLITCVVGPLEAIGIDVEDVTRKVEPVPLAESCMSSMEHADLLRLEGESQLDRFFQYWTLKESYIKARGMGLSLPLDQFSFLLGDRSKSKDIEIRFSSLIVDTGQSWHFRFMEPTDRHLVALGVKNAGRPIEVVVEWITPMLDRKQAA